MKVDHEWVKNDGVWYLYIYHEDEPSGYPVVQSSGVSKIGAIQSALEKPMWGNFDDDILDDIRKFLEKL